MIQRKQTVFLFLAAVLACICQVLPLGLLRPAEMGTDYIMYTTQITHEGTSDLSVFPMFALLLLSGIMSLVSIFLYRNRKRQSAVCIWNMAVLVVWYACFAGFTFAKTTDSLSFQPAFASILPLAAFIAVFMARRGIIHDEKLVRAADRIR